MQMATSKKKMRQKRARSANKSGTTGDSDMNKLINAIHTHGMEIKM
jgi:hypothetical protein